MSANKWNRSIFLFICSYMPRIVSSVPPSVCYPRMQMSCLPHAQRLSLHQNKSASAFLMYFLALLAPRRTNMLRSPPMVTWVLVFALWGVLRLDGEEFCLDGEEYAGCRSMPSDYATRSLVEASENIGVLFHLLIYCLLAFSLSDFLISCSCDHYRILFRGCNYLIN